MAALDTNRRGQSASAAGIFLQNAPPSRFNWRRPSGAVSSERRADTAPVEPAARAIEAPVAARYALHQCCSQIRAEPPQLLLTYPNSDFAFANVAVVCDDSAFHLDACVADFRMDKMCDAWQRLVSPQLGALTRVILR
jgi:hypothetical protein